MKVIECFAGSRSFGKIAESLNMQVFSIDIEPFDKIDLVKDMEFVSHNDIPFIPDIGIFMPPCTSYSIAAISHHRKGQLPISDFAIKSDRVLKNTLSLIRYYESVNPKFKWYLENPVGMLHKMDYMKGIERAKIYYCRYGDTRMKPTYIFTNNLKTMYHPDGWEPRRKCWNNNKKCHHEPAPRGSKTGTQGLKNDYERSKNPEELCKEILLS
jgi:hypothetical protein